jgi:hypothetical protein
VLRKTNSASEKSKKPLKVKPPLPPPPPPPPPVLPSPSPAPAPATPADLSVDVDDEILQAAEVPQPEPAPMEDDIDDVDEMLLSATAPAQTKRDDEDADGDIDDDLDAVLYDAADPSKAPPRRAPSVASSVEPPKAKVKASFDPPRAETPPPPPSPPPPPVAGPSHIVPAKRRRDPTPPTDKAWDGDAARQVPMDNAVRNRCQALLEHLTTDIDFGWLFAKPVDSRQAGLEKFVCFVFLGPPSLAHDCPRMSSYYTEITDPMDYLKMKKKISTGQYATLYDVAEDLELIYKNARKFNVLSPDILAVVDNVEKAWLSQWPKVVQGNTKATGRSSSSRTASRPVPMDGATKAAALKALSMLKDADR